MNETLLQKYNIPVPRYTSYPPANYFQEGFSAQAYEEAIHISNTSSPEHLSFYIHIPFCRRICHYCGCNSFPMMKPEVINNYLSALHKEMDMIIARLNPSRKIAQIHYGGGSPTILPVKELEKLNKHLLSAFSTIEHPEIAIECHPGYMEEDYLHGLIKAGFNRVSLGIQDFNTDVLKVVNRQPSLLPVETIFSVLRAGGVKINLDFLYGLPLQTVEGFSSSIRQAVSLHPDRLVTFSYGHLPHLFKRQQVLEKTGFPTPEEKSRMYEQAKELLTQSGYKAIGLDHFVQETDELYTALSTGTLHRNFQGYCTRRTTGQIYALGVTAISSLSTAYSQNSKDILTYIQMINNGEFAVTKGYQLSLEEQITAKAIETLMCNYQLDWLELAGHFALSVEEVKQATAYSEMRMKEFAEDGIITYNSQQIKITPQGTLYVRNVAASLDKLMLHTNKSYSKPV